MFPVVNGDTVRDTNLGNAEWLTNDRFRCECDRGEQARQMAEVARSGPLQAH